MRGRQRRLRDARRGLDAAADYSSWQAAAAEFDEASGLDAWRHDDDSPHYHPTELRKDIDRFQVLGAAGDVVGLLDFLHASLHRHLNDLFEPALYAQALSGTKHLITRYLDTVEGTIRSLVYREVPGWTAERKLEVVRRAYTNLGRSALLLSGGATLGFYHLGVGRALWKAGLMPEVVSGASMGAMIASGFGCRTDAELDALFEPELPDIERVGLEWRSLREMARAGTLMKPERLLATIQRNCGRYTFAEAYERSGRVLNISLSPTRTRQKPRVLSHLTAPDVWVPVAALASSAVPGLFPPTTLIRKRSDGTDGPYIPSERWIDGSFGADLPMMRIARLHNVNHFIVSQTQPHALPLLSGIRRQGLSGLAIEAAAGWAKAQGVPLVSAGRRVASKTPLRTPVELLHSLVTQKYTGHIDIHPRFEPTQYRKLLKNPSPDELRHFVREGERAAWPRLQMVNDHTRLSRCLAACERHLEAQLS